MFRSKSGYTGLDIGRFHQPGSNGLTFDPDGRLVICQHGNRRILRVNPHGDTTVLADSFEGRRLNSPNDVVGPLGRQLCFTDPPFGLPGMFDDPDRELDFSGVFRVRPPAMLRSPTLARGAKWHRVLARRAVALRRQLGPGAQGRHALRAGRSGEVLDRRSCST